VKHVEPKAKRDDWKSRDEKKNRDIHEYIMKDGCPASVRTVTVAGKLGLDVPPGTLKNILKQASLK